LLPNFENFNVMAMAAHGGAVPGVLILQNTLYTVIYCTIVLTAAAAVFSRPEFEMNRRDPIAVGAATDPVARVLRASRGYSTASTRSEHR